MLDSQARGFLDRLETLLRIGSGLSVLSAEDLTYAQQELAALRAAIQPSA